MVQNATETDLILQLSTTENRGGYVATGRTQQPGSVDESGKVQLHGQTTTGTEQTVENRTQLNVIDPQTGQRVWSDSMRWGYHFRSATRRLIEDLRKRAETQEASISK